MAISGSTQKKLLDAVTRVSGLVEQADHTPDSALEKVAKDLQLRQGEITLVARAYNTGRANAIREAGTDLFEKTAVFDLAHADFVIESLFPSGTQQHKAAAVDDTLLSIDYIWAPETLLPKRAAAAVSDIDIRLCPTAAPAMPRDPVLEMQAVQRKAASLKKAVDYWLCARTSAIDAQVRAFDDIGETCRAYPQLAFNRLKHAAAVYHGDEYVLYLDAVEQAFPKATVFKRAEDNSAPLSSQHPVFEKLAAFKEATVTRQYVETTCLNIESGMAALQDHAGDLCTDSAIPYRTKLSGDPLGHGNILTSLLGQGQEYSGINSEGDAINNAVTDIGAPQHEAKLRQIAVSANLQRMLSRDPVIKGYQPAEVADAFNSFAQLSPKSVDKDLPLRMALRKQLSQDGVETHEQQQYVDLDNALGGANTRIRTEQPALEAR